MAALDFGMALARGMLPKAEAAQKDLLNLAGGRNIFKSEDWWNKAVDEQIKSGYRESQTGTVYKTTSGDWAIGSGKVNIQDGQLYGSYKADMFEAPKDALIKGYSYPRNTGGGFWGLGGYSAPSPIYETQQVTYYGPDTGRKDYTAGELSDITASAKRGAEQAKRIAAERQATRKKRGTGGVLAKARIEGEGPATGLPALGEGGLGITGSILGGGIKL